MSTLSAIRKVPKLGGVSTARTSRIYAKNESWHKNLLNPYSDTPTLNSSFVKHFPSPLINRRSRRKLARELCGVSYHTQVKKGSASETTIELKKHLSRPPGCSFLGARATETLASLDDSEESPIPIIVDSGSDITLISQKTLDQMCKPPKIRTGQRINLIQVTGNAIITGYVTLDVYFKTDDGPVLIKVEAYVVKGMSTPFLLGNDFADQYSISLLREEGQSSLLFGKSGRSQRVHNSVTSSLIDEDGHAFKVRVRPNITTRIQKARIHRKSQKMKRQAKQRSKDNYVRTVSSVNIAPESTRLIEVRANFDQDSSHLFIEKRLTTNGGPEDIYGCADALITKDAPFVYISNFSQKPVTITAGQVISQGYDPSTWLDNEDKFTQEQ